MGANSSPGCLVILSSLTSACAVPVASESAKAIINPCLRTMNIFSQSVCLWRRGAWAQWNWNGPGASALEETMREEDLLRGAERILDARRSVAKLDGLPEPFRPRSLDDGYRMQLAAAQRWGDEVAGWKVGATSQ